MAQQRVGLLDADIVAYQIAATNEVRIDWDGDGDISQYPSDVKVAYGKVDYHIGELIQRFKFDRMVICLTDKVNWRHTVLPTYKQNRKGLMKPLLLNVIKEYLATEYESYLRPGLEADDVMGILSTHPTLIPGKKVIISIDKDMKQIPGYLYNPDKDPKPYLVKKEDGDRFHWLQTLTGDAVDGYSGCPGIGLVKANRILDDTSGTPWERIVSTYESKGLTEQDAIVQAQVAKICQYQDFDYEANEVIPWLP